MALICSDKKVVYCGDKNGEGFEQPVINLEESFFSSSSGSWRLVKEGRTRDMNDLEELEEEVCFHLADWTKARSQAHSICQ